MILSFFGIYFMNFALNIFDIFKLSKYQTTILLLYNSKTGCLIS